MIHSNLEGVEFLVTDHVERFQHVGAHFLGTVPSPVRWVETMQRVAADGATLAIEPGPGQIFKATSASASPRLVMLASSHRSNCISCRLRCRLE